MRTDRFRRALDEHYRSRSAGTSTPASRRGAAERVERLHVVETGVVATSKGQAIEALRAETGARAVFYMGDDVTDERAFAVLHDGDVSVRVGPGETVARHRVADPDEAALVLTRLADLLTGASTPG